MDVQLAPPAVEPSLFGDGPTVWRRWRVVPSRSGALLTGLLGFPWRGPSLEARCTALDPSTHRGHYHRVTPALGCTCGIYAAADGLDSSVLPRSPWGEPVVEGFVALGGRVIREGHSVRASQALIAGPLIVRPGRRHPGVRPGSRPARLIDRGDRYRVKWSSKRVGQIEELAVLVASLRARYRVDVLTAKW